MARFNTGDSFTLQNTRAAKVEVFRFPGQQNWTVPAGVTCATFELWGAGGGGGAKCCCDCYHAGGGGGAGNYTSMTMPVTPGALFCMCIGAGGMYTESSNGPYHLCCQGGTGQPTYITGTGTNITTLCAGGGSAGNNMCYSYCICDGSYSGCHTIWGSCSVANTATDATVNCIQAGNSGWNVSNGGKRMGGGTVGYWTDSTGNQYKSVASGAPWQSSTVNTVNWCMPVEAGGCKECSAQAGCALGGQAGQGSFSAQCCGCMYAGVGANGLILIRY